MLVEDESDWKRAFFARLIAGLGLLPFAYTALFAFMVPDAHDGAKEPFVFVGSAISLAFFLMSLSISHLPYLRERETSSIWHFGRIEITIVGTICTLLVYLLLASCWFLLRH